MRATNPSCYFLPMNNQQRVTGAAIRALRKAAGIRQSDAAAIANISASHLSRVEKGERAASTAVTAAILAYLGVDKA